MDHVTARDLVNGCAMEAAERRYTLYQRSTHHLPNNIPVDRRTQYVRTLIHLLSLDIRDQYSY